LFASLFLCCGNAFAQSIDVDKEPEPVAIVELGGAGSWNLKGGSSLGADVAAEVTPIENWLELEAGVTPLFTRHSTEWDTDLLFQKALDPLEKNRVHDRHWPGVGSHSAIRRDNEFIRRRGGAGFYVLALRQA
jgi:hypothetical protein